MIGKAVLFRREKLRLVFSAEMSSRIRKWSFSESCDPKIGGTLVTSEEVLQPVQPCVSLKIDRCVRRWKKSLGEGQVLM